MNKFQLLFIVLGVSFSITVFNSCDEISHDLVLPIKPELDTAYIDSNMETPQSRVVLVEEFTGVRCVICPQGHAVTAQLLEDLPDNVAVIAAHTYFAGPFPFSAEDYQINAADILDDFLGPVSGWPAAAIDRKDWGDGEIVYVANEWITRVNDRLGVTPPANLYLESDFDEATSEMLLTVTIKFTTDVPVDTRLSIAITENDIVDAQETPAGVDSFYVHQHTLRDMITPPTGIPIDVSTPAGRVIIKQLRYSIPEHWDADHCEVVAFVHKNDGSKTVLQTAKAYVED